MTATAPDPLWEKFARHRDPEARSRLLERYLGLVYHCAGAMAARLGDAVEFGDLLGAGSLGLVQSIDRFDRSRGLAFTTFAVQRIRGAILDELRSRDWRPRSVRIKGRLMAATASAIEKQTGFAPSSQELARAMGIDLKTYHRIKEDAAGRVAVALTDVAPDSSRARPACQGILEDPDRPEPLDQIAQTEAFQQLRRSVRPLPVRQRAVLAMYYHADLNLKQIAEVLGVSESRVSQLRTQAIRSLRSLLPGRLVDR